MTDHLIKSSAPFHARLAGWLYLLVIPLGIFGGLYVPSKLIVSGDAAATAANLLASESLFRLGIVSELLASIDMLFVVLLLYGLLKFVNKSMALLMVMLVAAGASIAMLSKVFQFAPLMLAGSDPAGFTAGQVQALITLFLGLHNRGGNIAFIFWGLWLFPLGWLVVKSGFFPRIIGILLMIASFGYALNSFAILLGYSLGIGMFSALGEIVFILWLLIRGVNAERWEERARASG